MFELFTTRGSTYVLLCLTKLQIQGDIQRHITVMNSKRFCISERTPLIFRCQRKIRTEVLEYWHVRCIRECTVPGIDTLQIPGITWSLILQTLKMTAARSTETLGATVCYNMILLIIMSLQSVAAHNCICRESSRCWDKVWECRILNWAQRAYRKCRGESYKLWSTSLLSFDVNDVVNS